MSVDIVETHPYKEEDFRVYRENGWEITSGSCSGRRGMANNMLRGLQRIDGDLLLYCEDDVVINRIPSREVMEDLFFGPNSVGCVVYNTHAHCPWLGKKGEEPKLKYINDRSNYFCSKKSTRDLFLVKSEFIKDEYWICFPVAIMKTEVFRSLLNRACTFSGLGMEPGMTKAWFELGFGKWSVVMYVKEDTLDSFPIDFQELYNKANMQFWNNDANLRHPSINNRQNTIF